MNNNLKGFAYGIATSVTFGLIPLFTLPLMEKGMRFDSILFYRFLFAAIALSGMLLAKKESFRTEMRNLPILILLGAFYKKGLLKNSFCTWRETSSYFLFDHNILATKTSFPLLKHIFNHIYVSFLLH